MIEEAEEAFSDPDNEDVGSFAPANTTQVSAEPTQPPTPSNLEANLQLETPDLQASRIEAILEKMEALSANRAELEMAELARRFERIEHLASQDDKEEKEKEEEEKKEEEKAANETCVPPAILQFPTPGFNKTQRRYGALIFHIMFCIYMFMGLAIVCDDFFVPALDKISDGKQTKPVYTLLLYA